MNNVINKKETACLTPCQQLEISGVKVWVKREDLNHPIIQGNKLRKLKYNLIKAQQDGIKTLITFGGAYSNHLHATAYAAKVNGYKAIALVRGDELKDNQHIWSETLNQCQELGMQLVFTNRNDYRSKEHSTVFKRIWKQADQPVLLPEGGSNQLAVKGMAEIVSEIRNQLGKTLPTHIICPVGTGATLAGIIQGVADQDLKCQVTGVAVLKGLHSVKDDIKQWLKSNCDHVNWNIVNDFHCGGYARSTPELEGFCLGFTQQHDIQLDRVYNSKSFYALAQIIKNKDLSTMDRPLIIHTGGIQGGVFNHD